MRKNNTQPNIFVNSGIRNKINTGILSPKDIELVGNAIGCLLSQEFDDACSIVVATDTRPSGSIFKTAICQGLTAFGHNVYDAGIAPTPFVAKALKDYHLDLDQDETEQNDNSDFQDHFFTLGIVITASHNPAEYNGIKILTNFGYLNLEMEEEISKIFYEFQQNNTLLNRMKVSTKGSVLPFDLISFYKTEIHEQLESLATNNQTKNLTVLLDCANGATTQIAPQIFKKFGINTIAINNSLDGELINFSSGCSNPQLLIDAITKHNADWGCAFDGDGDRVVIANKHGDIFDGDDILVILAQHNRYKNNNTFIGNIMSNQGVTEYFQVQHKQKINTPVGERNLIEALIEHQAYLGSEPCGHIIVMDHAFCSDGIFSALLFLETILTNPSMNLRPYKKYVQVHTTINLQNKIISPKTIQDLVKQVPQSGRIIARLSNTEPIIRIMVEHKESAQAEQILEILKTKFLEELK